MNSPHLQNKHISEKMAPMVHPEEFLPSSESSASSTSTSYLTSKREVFTIWMKSLVMNSNGCTVFDSNGDIVYRIDNYDIKCRDQVYLMDLKGKVLCTILRKKLRFFGRWEGYEEGCSKLDKGKPWFQVRKPWTVLKCGLYCNVDTDQSNGYRIEKLDRKLLDFRIVDQEGVVVAEMKQKQSKSGVVLGNDVFTLVVESNVDHSLIMGLVVVHGLINRKL